MSEENETIKRSCRSKHEKEIAQYSEKSPCREMSEARREKSGKSVVWQGALRGLTVFHKSITIRSRCQKEDPCTTFCEHISHLGTPKKSERSHVQ
jgi:hypothetical protein